MVPQSFFALTTLDGLEGLRREIGYDGVVQAMDGLRERVAAALPQARGLRANRASMEFSFDSRCPAAAEDLLRKLLDDLAAAARHDAGEYRLPVTVIAVPYGDGGITNAVVARADSLLVGASAYGSRLLIASSDRPDRDEDGLLADLRQALEHGGLELHYQPKLSARTGELAGTEALLRWRHPTLGSVPPDLFIPLAERSGDIRALTRWVLARAIADQGRFRDAGHAVRTAINISAPLLAEPGFAEEALSHVAGHTHLIGFEITETAMMADPEGSLARLRTIADAGVRLAVDDYGSGFSSLAYLQRLPVQELKIDRLFIGRLSTNARDPLLVRSTIDLAHALEMEVTAEGVETAPALALLQVMGCDLVQGYFLSAALPPDGLLAFMRDAASRAAPARPATLRERLAERRALVGGSR